VKPIQTTISYGGATGATGTATGATPQGGKAKKFLSSALRNFVIPWVVVLSFLWLGCHLLYVYAWTPAKETASDVYYQVGIGNENFILEPGGWKTIPSRVGTLTIEAEDPTQSQYLFGRATWNGGKDATGVMPLKELMAMSINVGTSQGYYEVGMGTGAVPKNVRVQVNRR